MITKLTLLLKHNEKNFNMTEQNQSISLTNLKSKTQTLLMDWQDQRSEKKTFLTKLKFRIE